MPFDIRDFQADGNTQPAPARRAPRALAVAPVVQYAPAIASPLAAVPAGAMEERTP